MAELMRVPVDVPPRAQENETPHDLSARINQIFNQKGAFRNVTEDTVANDVSSVESDDGNEDAAHNDTLDDEPDPERIARERNELFETITQSNIQINSALDFISMVLSQTSQIAKGSFSEGLRQAVGPGMFDSLVLTEGRVEPNVKSLTELSKGWKTTGYSQASQSLLAASKRLQSDAEQETSFWSQVAAIGEKDWKISRHPFNSHIIGVHLGSSESAPQFRARGFAPLRRGSNSELTLDRSGLSRNRKRVSVAVIRNDRISGSYTPSIASMESGEDILGQINDARDDLFDEELFHELGREARLAANQGIVARGDDLEFAIDHQIHVRISLRMPAKSSSSVGVDDDALAKSISLSLRSLLVQAHHENRLKRSISPAPISTRPVPRAEYAILRPLIATLRHSIAVAEVRLQIERLVSVPLKRAGLETSFSLDAKQANSAHVNSSTSAPIISTSPQNTSFTLVLPTGKQAELKTTTYLGRPTYGTSYEVSEVVYDFATSQMCHYDTAAALAMGVVRLTILDLVALAAEKEPITGEETKTRRWSISQPRKGLLMLSSSNVPKIDVTLRLQLESGTLVALIESRSSQRVNTRVTIAWTEPGTIYSGDAKSLNIPPSSDTTFKELIAKLVERD